MYTQNIYPTQYPHMGQLRLVMNNKTFFSQLRIFINRYSLKRVLARIKVITLRPRLFHKTQLIKHKSHSGVLIICKYIPHK